MSSIDQRDEYSDRLSSFLYQEGNLEVIKISKLKAYVFYIETKNGGKLILKRHRKKERVKQQWDFFNAIEAKSVVPFKRYPNGLKIISNNNYNWTIAPFMEGRKLDYKIAEDRKKAVKSVKNFHSKAQNIFVTKPIYKNYFFIRWYQRLQSFKETEAIFKEYGFETLYMDIVQTTVLHLRLIAKFPWDIYERDAKHNGLWVHGDVASHNFIQSNNTTYIIDYDLLQCTSQIYDFIQLGQRFLPFIDWDIDELLSYQMVKESKLKAWLYAIFIPSDIMREWLHFLYDNSFSTNRYLIHMEEDWIKRRYFLKNTKLMLR